MSRSNIARVSVIGILLCWWVGCSGRQGEPKSQDLNRIRVVATTTLAADTVRRIGGDKVSVETLMGPGVDPHTYTPSPGDLKKLRSADLVVYHGLHLEGKMAEILEGLSTPRAINLSSGIVPEKLLAADATLGGSHDPHIWFDVGLWAETIKTVEDGLSSMLPADAAGFHERAEAYRIELRDLDGEVRAAILGIPSAKRVLITSHDAFHYFGHAYGIEVKGLQGVSTAAEVSSQDVTELATKIGTAHIPTIFGETSVPTRGVDRVREVVKQKYGFQGQPLADRPLFGRLGARTDREPKPILRWSGRTWRPSSRA